MPYSHGGLSFGVPASFLAWNNSDQIPQGIVVQGKMFVRRRKRKEKKSRSPRQFSSVQDGIYALGKAHRHSTPSLRSFCKVVLETIQMFLRLTMVLVTRWIIPNQSFWEKQQQNKKQKQKRCRKEVRKFSFDLHR